MPLVQRRYILLNRSLIVKITRNIQKDMKPFFSLMHIFTFEIPKEREREQEETRLQTALWTDGRL